MRPHIIGDVWVYCLISTRERRAMPWRSAVHHSIRVVSDFFRFLFTSTLPLAWQKPRSGWANHMLPYHPHYSGQWCGTKQRRLSTLGWGCPSQSLQMPQRAGPFLKDLISNNADKLLSGDLSLAVSHHQSAGREEEKGKLPLPPHATRQPEPGMTLAYLQQGKRSNPTGAAAGGRKERNSVKRNAEPTVPMILKFKLCGSLVSHKKTITFISASYCHADLSWLVSQ